MTSFGLRLALNIIGLGGGVLIGAVLLSTGIHPILSLIVAVGFANFIGYIEGEIHGTAEKPKAIVAETSEHDPRK